MPLPIFHRSHIYYTIFYPPRCVLAKPDRRRGLHQTRNCRCTSLLSESVWCSLKNAPQCRPATVYSAGLQKLHKRVRRSAHCTMHFGGAICGEASNTPSHTQCHLGERKIHKVLNACAAAVCSLMDCSFAIMCAVLHTCLLFSRTLSLSGLSSTDLWGECWLSMKIFLRTSCRRV